MKREVFKNWSIIGMLLVVVSGVAAAILPSKRKTVPDDYGIIKAGTEHGHLTCTTALPPYNCVKGTLTTIEDMFPGTTRRNNTSGVTTFE